MPFELIPEVDRSLWERIADACPYATFFHHPLWFEVATRTFPATRAETPGFRLSGGRVVLQPLLSWKRHALLPPVFWTGPFLTYGGWISEHAISPAESIELTEWLLSRHPNLSWRMNPLAPHAEHVAPHTTHADTTEMLVLDGLEDEDALLARYRPAARRQVKKGIRQGLVARVATEWREWEVYFALYQQALQRWGEKANRPYPMEIFRQIHAVQGPKVRLWVVTVRDEIVGGELFFYHGDHCVEWHAAYDPAHFAIGTRNYLVHQILVDARNRGIRHFDFNPSGGHEGTRTFKQTFGTTSLPARFVENRSLLYRSAEVRKLYYRVRRKSW